MNTFSLFSANHIAQSYLFFDFETTGFYPLAGDRIIEIAMIKVINGTVVEKYETLINPGRPIPEEASSVNNIHDEDVQDAPFFDKEIALKILQLTDDSVLVAHNAAFDLGFLAMELARNGISFTEWRSIDTLQIARDIFPNMKNKLKSLIDRYNIKQVGELHRALADTEALVDVFFNLIDEEKVRTKQFDEIVQTYGFTGTSEMLQRYVTHDIRTAIENGSMVTGRYKKRNSEVVQLSFVPQAVVWHEGRWFLCVKNSANGETLYLYNKRLVEYTIGG